jgi:hypothetical protein
MDSMSPIWKTDYMPQIMILYSILLTDIDECAPNPCGSGGTCFDAINGYNCVCAPGYSGVNCEIGISDAFIYFIS